MSDILDQAFGAETSPVDLTDLVPATPLNTSPAPIASVRNRASQAAMLSGNPANAVDNYQTMLSEHNSGQDTTYQVVSGNIDKSVKQADLTSVLSALADPTRTPEQKQALVKGLSQNNILNDKSVNLQSNLLTAPSDGETHDSENARISTADTMREMYDARTRVQGLVNGHIASLENRDLAGASLDFLAGVLPFSNSIQQVKIGNAIAEATGKDRTLWGMIKDFAQPGTATSNIRERLESLPPEKRVQFAQAVKDAIANHSGLIFGNDNQYNQFENFDKVFQEGGYSDTAKFVDNVAPLLDAIGVGSMAKKGVQTLQAARAAKAIDPATEASTASRADTGTPLLTDKPIPTDWEVIFPPGGNIPGPKAAKQIEKEVVHPADWEVWYDRAPPSAQLANPQKKLAGPEQNLLTGPEFDAADEMKRIETNSSIGFEHPNAPGNVASQSNPTTARKMFDAATQDDEAAKAFYGTDAQDAVARNVFPQATTTEGAVTTKVADIGQEARRAARPDPAILDVLHDTGAIYFTRGEKAAARANAVNDFAQADGLVMNEAMSSFVLDGGRVRISGVYEVPGGSFNNAEQAMKQAQFALRNYGVTADDIQLLQKKGLDHVPVSLEEARGIDGDFKIRVNLDHEIRPSDVDVMEQFDVKRNYTDRFAVTTGDNGSMARWMMDAQSMLHPVYTGSASVADDMAARFGKVLLEKASAFSDSYTKLPKARKALVDDYIREANFNGIDFNQADLVARGFNPAEIDTLRNWRHFWDDHYTLENFDLIRTFRNEGYQIFKNANTELYARPIPKNSTLGRFYDPATDTVRQFTPGELDNLYATNGTMAKLRRTTDFNGTTADYMIVRNTPTEYLRAFRDTDRVLNYRKGYYQLSYNAPKYVDEILYDTAGREIGRKAVAVAGDIPEAQHFADRMSAANGGKYVVRSDDRALRTGSDNWFDVNSAGGRIAQRYRGKLLEDASGLNHLGDGSYIINPAQSAVRAAQSIAGRSVNRPMLDAAKERFVQQYEKYLPTDVFGRKQFPQHMQEIGAKGEFTTSELADARTTFEYIKYLENGYINSIDDGVKAVLHSLADTLGSRGFGKAERAVRAVAPDNLTGTLKGSVFTAYIGLNPLRQWVIQPAQSMRMLSYNPQGVLSGNITRLVGQYLGERLGLPMKADAGFAKFLDASGLADAVSKNNLVRGTLMDLADSSGTAVKGVKNAANALRHIGFDIGETVNILTHAGAVYDRRLRLGQNLADKTLRDEAFAEIRALSYGMNKANDMPYNQNTAAAVLQFLQMPHKALLQTTNRIISPLDRVKLLAGDFMLFGTPVALIGTMLGKELLPDNPDMRSFIQGGLVDFMTNHLFNIFYGREGTIDLGAIDPRGLDGWTKMAQALWTGGMSAMVTASPVGTLSNNRIGSAVKSIGRYFNMLPDYDNQNPTTFVSMLNDIARVTSGWNNASKAYLMLQMQQRRDAYGNLLDDKTTTPEAIAQLFGFGSKSQQDAYALAQKWRDDKKKADADLQSQAKDIVKYYAERNPNGAQDADFITGVTGAIMQVYKDDPYAMQQVQKFAFQYMQDQEPMLVENLLKAYGVRPSEDYFDDIKRAPISEETKAALNQILHDTLNARQQAKQHEEKK